VPQVDGLCLWAKVHHLLPLAAKTLFAPSCADFSPALAAAGSPRTGLCWGIGCHRWLRRLTLRLVQHGVALGSLGVLVVTEPQKK